MLFIIDGCWLFFFFFLKKWWLSLPLTLKSRRSGMEEGYENPDLLTVFQDGGDNGGTLGNSQTLKGLV